MRAVVRFLEIQYELGKITMTQLEGLVPTTLTEDEFCEICGKEVIPSV